MWFVYTSLKSGMSFTLTEHPKLDWLHFKGSTATHCQWLTALDGAVLDGEMEKKSSEFHIKWWKVVRRKSKSGKGHGECGSCNLKDSGPEI